MTNRHGLSEVALNYAQNLENLTFNSKPMILSLTDVAQENQSHCREIARVIEERIEKVPPSQKLSVLYLLDSIAKNVGGAYIREFSRNLVTTFCRSVESVTDRNVHMQYYRLLNTWPAIFPHEKIIQIEKRLRAVANTSGHLPEPNIDYQSSLLQSERAARNVRQPARTQDRPPSQPPSHVYQYPTGQRYTHSSQPQQNRRYAHRGQPPSQPPQPQPQPQPQQKQRPTHPLSNTSPLSQVPPHLVKELHRALQQNPSLDPSAAARQIAQGLDSQHYHGTQRGPHPVQPQPQPQPPMQTNSQPQPISQQVPRSHIQPQPQQPQPQSRIPSTGMGGYYGSGSQQPPPPPAPPQSQYQSTPYSQYGAVPYPSSYSSYGTPYSRPSVPSYSATTADPMTSSYSFTSTFTPPTTTTATSTTTTTPYSTAYPSHQPSPYPRPSHTPPTIASSSPIPSVSPSPTPSSMAYSSGIVSTSSGTSITDSSGYRNSSSPSVSPSNLSTPHAKGQHQYIVDSLYAHYQHQCTTCGVRFSTRKKLADHLDKHFTRTRKEKEHKALSRKWLQIAEEWIKQPDQELVDTPGELIFAQKEAKRKDEEDTAQNTAEWVIFDQENDTCHICGEKMEPKWDEDREEWLLVNSRSFEGNPVHSSCFPSLVQSKRKASDSDSEHPSDAPPTKKQRIAV